MTEARYKTVMRGLQRDARTMLQETGSNYLYLTIGTLVHTKGTGGEAHAPLFLLPVRIEGGTGRRPYYLVIDGTEIASPNYCLIEWLRVKHAVQIPELEQPARDEHGIDIPKTLAAINARLVEHRLNYRIDETASLRLLQFSTFQMWRDLTDSLAHVHGEPSGSSPGGVKRQPLRRPGRTGGDPPVDEANLHLPIPADGSQMQAIVMAERGYSFVLEGPPGTGKSQTITNLIARAVSTGRSVLFVAEKQAALDVVKRRLKQIGLGAVRTRPAWTQAVAQRHPRATPRRTGAVRRRTMRPAGRRPRPSTVRGSRRWPPIQRRCMAPTPPACRIWSAYDGALAYGEGPVATVPANYLAVPVEQQRRVDQALHDFPALAHSARLRPNHPWLLSGRRSLDGLHPGALVQIAGDLEAVRAELLAQPDVAQLVRGLAAPAEIARLLPGSTTCGGGNAT